MTNVRPIQGPGWTTQDPNEYDPDKKYTAATDERGHSGFVRNLRVPSDMVGQIARIVESGYYDEYTTQAALVRDAIHHHLEKLNKELSSENLKRTLSMNRLNSRVQQRRQETEAYQDMLTAIRMEVNELVAIESYAEAQAFIAEMRGNEDAVPLRFRESYDSKLQELMRFARPME